MKCPECNGRGHFLMPRSTPECVACLGCGHALTYRLVKPEDLLIGHSILLDNGRLMLITDLGIPIWGRRVCGVDNLGEWHREELPENMAVSVLQQGGHEAILRKLESYLLNYHAHLHDGQKSA